MISRLRGIPAGRTPDGLVLDVGGVGYLVAATPSALRSATDATEVTLETYLHVREDALQLYGFAEAAERELFLHLLGVSGIGPKVALAVVSSAPPSELRRAIALRDPARFQAIPGIGKKTAERIVLELEEKLGSEDVVSIQSLPAAPTSTARRRPRRAGRARILRHRGRAGARAHRSRSLGGGARARGAAEARHDIAVPGSGAPGGRRGGRAVASAPSARRLRRTGADEGAAGDRAAGGARAWRRARPRPAGRPARPRQDDAGDDHPGGARRGHPHGCRARARAQGRHGRDPHGTAGPRRPLRRRDPPGEPGDRGDPVSGARGLPPRHHRRPGRGRTHPDARSAAVHAGRRDHAHRAS